MGRTYSHKKARAGPRLRPPGAHIVIVNWNSGEWLRKCIRSIEAFGADAVDRITIVDNGSVDGSTEAIGDAVPLEIVKAGANLGFAAACNLGARGASAPYLLFLNPDAALLEDSLQNAIAYMESPEAAGTGVCGIQLVGGDGRIQRHVSTFPTARTIYTHAQVRAAFDQRESRDVDHVIGAFYLIRRELFEALGGFDERFFVYLEDLDLSLRVHEAGWKVHYLASAVGFHHGGGTSEQVKATRLFYAIRSRLLYAHKHFGRWQALAVALTTFSIEPVARLARAIGRGSPGEASQTLRAYGLLLRDLPRIFRIVRSGANGLPQAGGPS